MSSRAVRGSGDGPVSASGLVALLALAQLLVTGCAQLEKSDLPAQAAQPVSESSFWDDISRAQSGDWFYLLNTGDEALEWRLRMIDSARVSIDMETFLWKPDEAGQQILTHILAAADRGVTVRFLLDDSFTMHEDLELHAVDTHPNISLRIYNPFRHRSDSAFWREMFNIGEFTRINHRMHNKTLVVDGRAALIGGRNLADEYFGLHETMNFRDMEVITAGVSVPGVVGHFDNFWNSGWAFSLNDIIPERDDAPELSDFRVTLAANTPLLTAPDPEELARSWRKIADVAYPGQADFYFDEPANNDPSAADEAPDQLAGVLMDLVDSANSEVILISAYLVPTPEMEALVERVEARGVNVRILTNSLRSNNHVSAHAAYRKHLNRLVMHGADLHEVRVDAADRSLYMSAPVAEKRLGLHAKVLLIDETIAYIGSSNMDPRSLKVNTEVGLVIDSLELNRAIRDRVAIDFDLRNAWAVRQNDDGKIVWISDRETLSRQPADSKFQRLEDWFIGHLPIDSQM